MITIYTAAFYTGHIGTKQVKSVTKDYIVLENGHKLDRLGDGLSFFDTRAQARDYLARRYRERVDSARIEYDYANNRLSQFLKDNP